MRAARGSSNRLRDRLGRHTRQPPADRPVTSRNQAIYALLCATDRTELAADPTASLARAVANQLTGPGQSPASESSFQAAVLAAVKALRPTHRAVLILHRRDGLSYEEIATQLGMSCADVKARLAAALEQCCRMLSHPPDA